jgi:hypothetical protein
MKRKLSASDCRRDVKRIEAGAREFANTLNGGFSGPVLNMENLGKVRRLSFYLTFERNYRLLLAFHFVGKALDESAHGSIIAGQMKPDVCSSPTGTASSDFVEQPMDHLGDAREAASERPFVFMIRRLMLWAKWRLLTMQVDLKSEHAEDYEESNRRHCNEMVRLVQHYRLGIGLLSAGEWQRSKVMLWLNRAGRFEIMIGKKLDEAGVGDQYPDAGLVGRLRPVVNAALEEVVTLLGEVEKHAVINSVK